MWRLEIFLSRVSLFSWRYIRSERSVILINFCLSIISSNALILIGQTQTRNKVTSIGSKHTQIHVQLSVHALKHVVCFCSSLCQVVCTLVAAFLHFFFLSSFCWVLTEAWQSYMAVTGRLRNRIIRKRFLCLGWGELCLSAVYLAVFNQCLLLSSIHFLWYKLGTP